MGLSALCGACAATPAPQLGAPQQVPFTASRYAAIPTSSGDLASASGNEYESGKALSVPSHQRSTDSTTLVVRPDIFVLGFAVREERPTAQAALDAARATTEHALSELSGTLGGSVTAKTKDFSLSRTLRTGKPEGVAVTVDGTIEVRLNETQDFWVRSRLFTTIVETSERIAAKSRSGKDSLRAVSFESPHPEVLDPEAKRAELLQRWVARTNEFAELAEQKPAELYVRACTPPGAVTQSARSLDEVVLALAISCRVDTATGSGS